MNNVIEVNGVSKQYKLGAIGVKTLSDDIKRLWAFLRGRENPFSMVGSVNDRSQLAENDYVLALKNVNFEVKKGEVLGIIGRNGAGKSTLLKILSRVTTPSDGAIKMVGRVGSLLEVGTGFHPELTGRENIFLNGAILGMRKEEISKKLRDIISFSGCQNYIDTPVKRYSSGMKVRLGFSVAAHLEPEILIVDEVLAVGDDEFQKKCIGKMQEISRGDGRTILFVSHNLSSVQKLCSRVIYLDKGMISYVGDTNTAISKYLNSGQGEKPIYKRSGTQKDFAQIDEVQILKNEKVCSEFSVLDNIDVVICTSRFADIAYTFVGFNLFDSLGNKILFSSNEDCEISNFDKSTENQYLVTIPRGILKPGKYFLAISVQEKSSRKLDIVDEGLSFSVFDTATRRGEQGLYRRDAIIAPLLDWKTLN